MANFRHLVLVLCSVMLPVVTLLPECGYTPQEQEAQRILSRDKALFELIPARVNRACKAIDGRLENYKAGRVRIMRDFVGQVQRKLTAIIRLRDDMEALLGQSDQLRSRTHCQIHELLARVKVYEDVARVKLSDVSKKLHTLEEGLAKEPGFLSNDGEADLVVVEQQADDSTPHESAQRDKELSTPFSDEKAVQVALENDDVDALVDALAARSRAPQEEDQDEASELINTLGTELKKEATSVLKAIINGCYKLKRGIVALITSGTQVLHDQVNKSRRIVTSLKSRAREVQRSKHGVCARPELRRYVDGKIQRTAERLFDYYGACKRSFFVGLNRANTEACALPNRIKNHFKKHTYCEPTSSTSCQKLLTVSNEAAPDTSMTVVCLRRYAQRLAERVERKSGVDADAARIILNQVERCIFRMTHGTGVSGTPELYKRVHNTINSLFKNVCTSARNVITIISF